MDIKLPQFKKKQRFKKGGFHANPNRGWEILVILAAISIIASFAYGFSLYHKTEKELEASAFPSETREKLIDRERIEQALEYFALKEKTSEQILAAPARVVDPSR